MSNVSEEVSQVLHSIESKVSTLIGVIGDNHPGKSSAKALADEVREAIERFEDEGGPANQEKDEVVVPEQPEAPADVNENANQPGPVETPNGGNAAPQVNANTNAGGAAVPTPPVNAKNKSDRGQ